MYHLKMYKILVIVFSIVNNIVAENEGKNARVVGGKIAEDGQFPYQVSIRYNGSHLCSGTIVAEAWILTAAHCVNLKEVEPMTIYAGTNNLTTGGIEYNIDNVIFNDNWKPDTYENDIAMLHVDRPITLITNRASIGIMTRKPVKDGAVTTVAGWGWTQDVTEYPEQLHYIRQTKINQTECKKRGTPLLPSSMCMLSPSGMGLCGGDSGSPCSYQNRIVGVASYSVRCASDTYVYTELKGYVDWLQGIIINYDN